MIRVADYIFQSLEDIGIKTIFTVTGRGTLFLTDALAKNQNLKHVCTHHEQGAAFAAMAYALQKNSFGACLVSTGCASTNVITAVLCAWQDSIPLVIISGQNTLSETTRYSKKKIRTYGQQEADIIPIVSSITKYSTMITNPKDIAYEMDKAIYFANEGKKGPVWIDVPLDIQSSRVELEKLKRFKSKSSQKINKKINKNLNFFQEIFNKSKRPAVLIGSGIKSSKTKNELKNFINKNNIPLVYSNSAPDIYGSLYKNSIGSVGFMGCSRAGNFVVQNSDLLVVLGNRLSSMTTGTELTKFARNAEIVVVDIDELEHKKNSLKIKKIIQISLENFFSEIKKLKIKKKNNSWIKKCLHWKKIFPLCEQVRKKSENVDLYYLSEIISKYTPQNSTLITDSGLIEIILPTNIQFNDYFNCIHPTSQGAMGFALPAAVGRYYSDTGNIICVVGDGSIMMNLQELQTIVYNKIPIKLIVINNNAYSIIRRRQKDLFRNRTIGTDKNNGVNCPNFEHIARCFGLKYMKIKNSKYLKNGYKKLIDTNGPVLCEIKGLEDQSYIEVSITKDKNGKFVRRPLEDQWPFLDRELFQSEMIVNSIDQ